jgi:hypothetical protein
MALRELILGALDDAGGQEYLTRQAQNNPSAFLALLGKILPTKITGDPAQPLEVNTDPEERARRAREEIDAAFPERVREE